MEEEEETWAEEPIREVVEEVSVFAKPEEVFLHPVREAVDALARRYRPLHKAM